MTASRSPARRRKAKATPKQRLLKALDKFMEMHPSGKFCGRGEHCVFWQNIVSRYEKMKPTVRRLRG